MIRCKKKNYRTRFGYGQVLDTALSDKIELGIKLEKELVRLFPDLYEFVISDKDILINSIRKDAQGKTIAQFLEILKTNYSNFTFKIDKRIKSLDILVDSIISQV